MNNIVFKFLESKGYNNISNDYYNIIEQWINIWKGKSEWLDIKDISGKNFPMYSLGIAKRGCEDLASIITSEPFTIKAQKNSKELQDELEKVKLNKKIYQALEIMAYSGTVATVIRIKDAEVVGEGENAYLKKTDKTKKELVNINASQIIPLTWEDGKLVDVAIASEVIRTIDKKRKKLIYLELHILEEKGYQITNVYLDEETGKEVEIEGILKTYNTLSQTPLFAINKLPKENIYDNNLGLGMALYGDSIDQLKILDLVYNNFGMDFKLGQKIMVINKKLTRIETEEYEDKDGNIKTRQKVYYPSDLQKQQFVEITNGIMGDGKENPYLYEYNPDLRVGDNKEGIQFALDNISFKFGYGTHYYSFKDGNLVTATEALLSRKDFVDNGNKIRRETNEYIKEICRALLLSEKILGNINIDETQEIDIEEVDGFLQDDETQRQKLQEDVSAGLISKRTYLRKVYNMTDQEITEELQQIEAENNVEPITTIEDIGE